MPKYYFNLPAYDSLNDTQKAAIIAPEPVALSGGPGTGKSVVSLWRHITNHTKATPVRSQLLTFTTTLALYLKSCCESRSRISSQYVDSSLNWWTNHREQRPEIILDEAQDMSVEFNQRLLQVAPLVTYGADNQQILKSSAIDAKGTYNLSVCSPEEELHKIFKNKKHKLNKNYRSTQRIMQFAKAYFEDSFVHSEIIEGLSKRIGDLPRLIVTGGDLERQNEAILEIIAQYSADQANNIAILQPFANQPWADTEHWTAKYYFDLVKDQFDASYYDTYTTKIEEIKSIHCTPFKSSKGLEFDIVLIPNIEIVTKTFKVVNWRDFFVGVTRAKSQLILFSATELPRIADFVETVKI